MRSTRRQITGALMVASLALTGAACSRPDANAPVRVTGDQSEAVPAVAETTTSTTSATTTTLFYGSDGPGADGGENLPGGTTTTKAPTTTTTDPEATTTTSATKDTSEGES